ncbi:hypothetical protein PaecuDRAFT_4226 [Paenibacillus curdlanolyticus YK9]|uniref:Uncharacterized protein n=1 Tax=Paenibacillus curdlanolyticus YK9 TaxID=717606 RepID=E0IEY5_9BACL|nr:hypothetical protein PaecuDRAFT_4226 [Paenibacillus curdlanolyticus YK9]
MQQCDTRGFSRNSVHDGICSNSTGRTLAALAAIARPGMTTAISRSSPNTPAPEHSRSSSSSNNHHPRRLYHALPTTMLPKNKPKTGTPHRAYRLLLNHAMLGLVSVSLVAALSRLAPNRRDEALCNLKRPRNRSADDGGSCAQRQAARQHVRRAHISFRYNRNRDG